MAANKILICAGVVTLLQAVGQIVFCTLGLAQYYCVVDFLRELPMLLYIRIMYFHNPVPCGARINIGSAIEGIVDQAFVLINNEPLTAYRTFIINCTNLGIAGLWIPASILLIMGGAKNSASKHVRWPWVMVTVMASGVDLVAAVIYTNDSFYTRSLSDIMEFIGGVASGIANANLDTTWVSWIMVIVYARFIVFFFFNVILVVMVIVDCNAPILPITTGTQVEAPIGMRDVSTSDKDVEESSTFSEPRMFARLPRPGLSRSFRRMKAYLFRKPSPTPVPPSTSNPESYNPSPNRSPRAHHVDIEKKRTVNFPENLLSLPQRLENLIAEQQRRLDSAVIDTAGRNSPPRASQSLPQLPSTTEEEPQGISSRRGTAAELQGQLPWAYIPAARRMRDQLPPDEELPPVPLPDYTAIQPFRKASVHRAASSLSSLAYKRDALGQSRPTITQSDVLY
ncbi:uncharacterized protein LOC114366498 isoform X2 [Ostrinia furnacalis]|uniref:uncharacterized protein LOC114366498 isoform X2 n=1 Tax=Ostrinia furnacalis TaxID=93504 RepID=UPI00103C051D|nr:uncharacterized protein LOC114366498 isoform X2 [Ostrinia furnacalis]